MREMSLKVSKIEFQPDLTGVSTTYINIQNLSESEIIFKFKSSQPKRYHIYSDQSATKSNLFVVGKLSNKEIKGLKCYLNIR